MPNAIAQLRRPEENSSSEEHIEKRERRLGDGGVEQ